MRRSAIAHLVVIVLATIVTHTPLLRHRIALLGPDSKSYIIPAENFVAGRGLLGDGNVATFVDAIPGFPNRPSADAMRSPVVPLMIAAFIATGAGLRGVIVFQYALNLITAVAIYLFTRRRVGPPSIALAAALFFLSVPPVSEMANQIGSETLFTPLIFCTLVLARRACERKSLAAAVGSGVVLGLAVLTRPIAMYFVIAVAAVVLFATRRLALTVVLVIASQLLPAAWMWRNYRATGVATVSTIPADSLLSQWAAGIHATRNSSHLERLTASQRQLGFRAALHRSRLPLLYQAMAIARAEGVDPTALNPAQKSVYERRLALHIIRRHPIAMAELMLSAMVELQIVQPASSAAGVGLDKRAAIPIFVPVVLIALMLVIRGIRAMHRRDATLALLVTATICYFTVAAAIPETVSRYAIVYIPFYSMSLMAGLASGPFQAITGYVARQAGAPVVTAAAAPRR